MPKVIHRTLELGKHMDTATATLDRNSWTRLWRLQLLRDSESVKLLEIPDFEGDLRHPRAHEKLEAILGSWGYETGAAGWKRMNGGWVVTVVKRTE